MGEIEGVEEEEEREWEAQIAEEEVPRRDAIFFCVSFAACFTSFLLAFLLFFSVWEIMVVFGACGQDKEMDFLLYLPPF